ncbi:MAG TPA: TlpA disulfide reductase family protein [Bacteroidia bacterium]|jgi:thiol-disulfide isomerase/thioredoxin|nr:TlpA disulfide reductase family protein [Bacteroidia bacterium]
MLSKKKNKFFILFLLAACFIVAQKPAVYKINDLLKRIHNNSDTIYIVNFWATWCKPCIQELPDFESFSRQNKSALVKIILVTMDFKEDLKTKVIPFLEKNKYSSEVVLLDEVNGNDFINKINTKWSGAIPATYFTTKNKKKEELIEKKVNFELLNAAVNDFLK